jgi:hypothetical protein
MAFWPIILKVGARARDLKKMPHLGIYNIEVHLVKYNTLQRLIEMNIKSRHFHNSRACAPTFRKNML